MKKINLFVISVAATAALVGCSDSYNVNEAAGQGRLILRPTISTDLAKSRALEADEIDELSQSCTVWISSNGRGLVRKYDGLQNVPTDGIWLVGGDYTAEAWAGDSVPASFDSRYFYGNEPFTIAAGGVLQVDLQCKIINTAVSVKYAEGVENALKDFTMTVGHSCGSLTWTGRDTRRGYFMMNSRDKDLVYELRGTTQDGNAYVLSDVIKNVKKGTEYVLNVNYNATDVNTGGAFFTVEIDETTDDQTHDITIIPAPSIVGVYQPLDEPVYGEANKMTRQGVYVAAATELKSVKVSAPSLAPYLGVGTSEFDMIRADAAMLDELSSKGVKGFRQRNEELDLDNIKITFEPELLNTLAVGEYDIVVTATVNVPVDDERTIDKSNTATLKIIITDAAVEAEKIAANDPSIWASEVTLKGKVLKDEVETAGFKYRQQGSTEWTDVEGTPDSRSRALTKGANYTARITGLTPGTTYEYVAYAGDFVSGVVNTFTTEAAAQLPNAGFEDWFKPSGNNKPYYVAPSSEGFFWDSGNHGSCTLGINITQPSTEYKHSGNYSAKLESQKVSMMGIGAFAAGNVFVGAFLGTEKTTKGILGWGRPWTSRPRALKCYVKYTPQAITEVGGAPAGVTVNKGDMDAGIIYIGIVDDSKMTYTATNDKVYGPYPQIVATQDINNYGFKSTGSNVIAYGEKVFTEATPGNDMVEITIPLDYVKTDVKAANIILVVSASRYGDYYTGGPSVMYIDDFELIY